jgi:8-oxo-dGTP pyrophosphatase MutT (NUDIX family)
MTAEPILPPHASPASRYRLTLARELAASCPIGLGRVIALTGSVARGVADSLSDIEIMCWVEGMPEMGSWIPWLRGAGADVVYPLAGPSISDGSRWTGCRFRGIWVEVGWNEIGAFDALIESLTRGEERDEQRRQIGWIVQTAAPLRDGETLAGWQERLRRYPDALQAEVIRANTSVWSDPHVPPVRWALVARDERLGLSTRLRWDLDNILEVLCAVNRRWPQDWKWTDERSLDFASKPERLSERIKTIVTLTDPAASVRACFSLILDTLALVPSSIDVRAARENVEAALAHEPRITRACAAVLRGDTILMVECRHATHSHWTLPGGRIDAGEAPEEAALRELEEEAGLQGVASNLLYVRPWGRSHGEGLEVCFLVKVPHEAEPILGSDPELEQQGQELVGVDWRPLAQVEDDIQVREVVAALGERLT